MRNTPGDKLFNFLMFLGAAWFVGLCIYVCALIVLRTTEIVF